MSHSIATKNCYGDEYPAAVVIDGIRLPLISERRFVRFYENSEARKWALIPRFMDGSAEMNLHELVTQWPTWSKRDRSDFCLASSFLSKQSDYLDVLRFVMKNGGSTEWGLLAGAIATNLPCDEAFELLDAALQVAKDSVAPLNISYALNSLSRTD